jgi:hypothetical protein
MLKSPSKGTVLYNINQYYNFTCSVKEFKGTFNLTGFSVIFVCFMIYDS